MHLSEKTSKKGSQRKKFLNGLVFIDTFTCKSGAEDRRNTGYSHPISVFIRQVFSRRLSEFALGKVRHIAEGERYGKVVYASGDDVLALLPTEEALSCAYELHSEFRNILGWESSASAGVAIAHHRYPLSLALQSAGSENHKA